MKSFLCVALILASSVASAKVVKPTKPGPLAEPGAKGTMSSKSATIQCAFREGRNQVFYQFVIELSKKEVQVNCVDQDGVILNGGTGPCFMNVNEDTWQLTGNERGTDAVFSNYIFTSNPINRLKIEGTNHFNKQVVAYVTYGPKCNPYTLIPCLVDAQVMLTYLNGPLIEGANASQACRVDLNRFAQDSR